MSKLHSQPVILLGQSPLTLEGVLAIAHGTSQVAIDQSQDCLARIDASAALIARLLGEPAAIYGVTTGVGDSVTTEVSPELAPQLPLNLLRFHGCGLGPMLSETQAAAVMAVRLASLVRGHSGVRLVVIQRICDLLNLRILPQIPSIGSVGASGDLTPLSYLAALLVGEREALVDGKVVPAKDALQHAGLHPLTFLPKESLTLMNGTSVMTALACSAFARALRLARWVAALTAAASDVLRGNPQHFDARLFALKPHPGQGLVAAWIREDIEYDQRVTYDPARLQDRYSIRCVPQIVGVLIDGLLWQKTWIETEINSVNDNPIVDSAAGEILHGGNFYGGHIGFVMDGMKTSVANLADLLDRQLATLSDDHVNAGLPVNLVGVQGHESAAHHGFKAMAIATSALAAEALKLTMPASAFSRSTENHNQDKVPMATIAARDCLQILDLTEASAAIMTLAVCQAVDLRQQQNCHDRSRALHASVREVVPMLREDRRMDLDIAQVLRLHAEQRLQIGSADLTQIEGA